MLDVPVSLTARLIEPDLSRVVWMLWVQQDGDAHGLDHLWAGRVKLQDDPIASAYCVLDDAIKKLEATLGGWRSDPLF